MMIVNKQPKKKKSEVGKKQGKVYCYYGCVIIVRVQPSFWQAGSGRSYSTNFTV